jgi:hypothetical protein
MSRCVNDSTTYFQGTDFSYHKPYILDPGGSANIAVPKFQQAPIGAFLKGSKFFSNSYYFNDPISPVGSGTSNTAVSQAKPQGLPRNIFQKRKKHVTNHEKKQFLPSSITPNFS